MMTVSALKVSANERHGLPKLEAPASIDPAFRRSKRRVLPLNDRATVLCCWSSEVITRRLMFKKRHYRGIFRYDALELCPVFISPRVCAGHPAASRRRFKATVLPGVYHLDGSRSRAVAGGALDLNQDSQFWRLVL